MQWVQPLHWPSQMPPVDQSPKIVRINRVTADGFNTLSTQHYPAEGSSKAEFDLVLIPD
jgi:hypothetical protein